MKPVPTLENGAKLLMRGKSDFTVSLRNRSAARIAALGQDGKSAAGTRLFRLCVLAVVVTTATPNRVVGQRPDDALRQLIEDAATRITEHFAVPLGQVTERTRSRVYVSVRGQAPERGTSLVVFRRREGLHAGHEALVAKLVVQGSTPGLLECKETERQERVESGDWVRLDRPAARVLLAPCVSLIDVAPVIPQVIGERLRAALLGRANIELHGDLALEQHAEAAYWSGTLDAFLAKQRDVESTIFPVLMRTDDKLIVNLEYFSSARQRATDIDVLAIDLDATALTWMRAGGGNGAAPPGFRALARQLFPWRVRALGSLSEYGIVAVTSDSAHVLAFEYPGLRQTASIWLGAAASVQRAPRVDVLRASDVRAVVGDARLEPELARLEDVADSSRAESFFVLSDERSPCRARMRFDAVHPSVQVSSLANAAAILAQYWRELGGANVLADHSWPHPTARRFVIMPVTGDINADQQQDLLWSDQDGRLHVRTDSRRRDVVLEGFGDVKAVQPMRAGGGAIVWLTDPVWDGQPDRLHAAQWAGRELDVFWTSEPFAQTLVALACTDLNADGAHDLVAAEAASGGTRLHLYVGLPGESTRDRGAPVAPPGRWEN